MPAPDVFLDTSAFIAGLLSPSGGARALFALGEAGALALWCSADVLAELDAALTRKLPNQRPLAATWLERMNLHLTAAPSITMVRRMQRVVHYEKDAVVLGAALAMKPAFLVSLDREHMLSNTALRSALPFPIGTPGDCLAWLRAR